MSSYGPDGTTGPAGPTGPQGPQEGLPCYIKGATGPQGDPLVDLELWERANPPIPTLYDEGADRRSLVERLGHLARAVRDAVWLAWRRRPTFLGALAPVLAVWALYNYVTADNRAAELDAIFLAAAGCVAGVLDRLGKIEAQLKRLERPPLSGLTQLAGRRAGKTAAAAYGAEALRRAAIAEQEAEALRRVRGL